MVEAYLLFPKTNLVKVGIAQLVAGFELPVILRLFLHSIIGQVNKLIVAVGEAEFFAACPDISLFVIPSAEHTLLLLEIGEVAEECEDADVEFAAVHEEWILNIPLEDTGLILLWSIIKFIKKALFDFLEVVEDLDAMTSVCLLARLHDPPTILLKRILECFELIVLKNVATFHFLW